jgi:predicted DNA-binding antitoxin AbrB/MazE fold protein
MTRELTARVTRKPGIGAELRIQMGAIRQIQGQGIVKAASMSILALCCEPNYRESPVTFTMMVQTLQAVYENGVLRPLEPLALSEHQRVVVTVSDPAEQWLDHEYMEKVTQEVAAMGPAPSLEEVRRALSKIPGNLSDDIRAERESR